MTVDSQSRLIITLDELEPWNCLNCPVHKGDVLKIVGCDLRGTEDCPSGNLKPVVEIP